MSQLLRTKSFAACSLVLVGAGLIAVACGSDKGTNTQTPQLTPGAAGTSGNATSQPPATMEPGTPTNTPVGNPNGNGTATEGPNGNIPIEQPPPDMPNGNPNNNPPVTPTPTTGLAPNCNPAEGAVPNLALQSIGTFAQPIYVTGVAGDDSRLFVVEKAGAVRVIVNGELQQAPFINITNMVTNGGERGLLGLAFHPDFANNGLFYLHFSSNGQQGLPANGTTILAEFQAPGDHSAGDPATRRIVMTIGDTEPNHNGGQIVFGRDGFLYWGMGDGGGGNDQHGATGNGQNLNALLGKILRIDPMGRAVNNAYSVPPQNFAQVTNQTALPEIWASGLRNPWRFSFDACTGDLYIGDVGQDTQEEIDFVAAAADTKLVAAGRNFGWRVAEATICRPNGTEPCNAQVLAGLTGPIDSYAIGMSAGGQRGSVTGGYVYRGSAIPGLRGTYIYADYARGSFARFRVQNGQLADRVDITTQMRAGTNIAGNSVSSFGTDNAGEMYVTVLGGGVFKVVAAQ